MRSLRTLIDFVTRMNPANEPPLAEQLSSYVDHVLGGHETKIVQQLRAHAQAAQPQEKVPVLAQARAAERGVAAEHDLKSLVLSLVRQPPAGGSPQLEQGLADALVTLTAAQLHALSPGANPAASLALALPVTLYEGGRPTQIRISRDAPGRRERLDADNFHIAFVLDTASLGSVAIDLETVGREVRVNVKTERPGAVPHFERSFPELRTRLEGLRYTIASMAAAVLSPQRANPPRPTAPAAQSPATGLDLQA